MNIHPPNNALATALIFTIQQFASDRRAVWRLLSVDLYMSVPTSLICKWSLTLGCCSRWEELEKHSTTARVFQAFLNSRNMIPCVFGSDHPNTEPIRYLHIQHGNSQRNYHVLTKLPIWLTTMPPICNIKKVNFYVTEFEKKIYRIKKKYIELKHSTTDL